MLFIGDTHGDLLMLQRLLVLMAESHPEENVIQVGDLGIGFGKIDSRTRFKHPKFRFIRGNHDSPLEARNHTSYLGEYGFNKELGVYFVSGAWSIDKEWRTPNKNWWEEEELTEKQCELALADYAKHKPMVMVTHEAPHSVLGPLGLYPQDFKVSRTGALLQLMLEVHRPACWLFGHWHRSSRANINGTDFVALAPFEMFRLGGE